jgi:hypothetical protein
MSRADQSAVGGAPMTGRVMAPSFGSSVHFGAALDLAVEALEKILRALRG